MSANQQYSKLKKRKSNAFFCKLIQKKIMELKLKIKTKAERCQIHLDVSDTIEKNQIFSQGFQCQQNIQQQYFVQKFHIENHHNQAKFKICVKCLMAYKPIFIDLIINQKINPLYFEQQISFTTSIEIRNINQYIHKLSHSLVKMEQLQYDYTKVAEYLSDKNLELKQYIKNLTLFQSILIFAIGIIWVLILKRSK